MSLFKLLVAGVFCLLPLAAASAEPVSQPDLISFGAGYANFDKHESRRKSVDMRFEYRWGTSLLPQLSSSFDGFDKYMQFHPFLGVNTSSLGILYGLGGFAADVPITRHLLFTWSEGVGLFYPGRGMPMGSVMEIRSSGELGWRFSNEMRLTAYASHTSNAKITGRNPGSEIVGMYFHVPTRKIFGR